MSNQKKNQYLALLAIIALIVFNYPFISIANKEVVGNAGPSLFVFIIFCWVAVIGISAYIINKITHTPDE